jgi:serine protease Do
MIRHVRAFSLLLLVLVAAAASVAADEARPDRGTATPTIGPLLFRDIARRQNPAVVTILTRSQGRPWNQDEADVLRMFGVQPSETPPRMERSLASGFLISPSGEILTNRHVIEDGDKIEVTLYGNDRKRYRALLVGSDAVSDTALLRLENPPPDLHFATLGDSSTLQPGDWVMAIGNPFQLGHTVTVGLVSFVGRWLLDTEVDGQDMIQTDAAVNQGNSGGPLIDMTGDVIGITTAIVGDAEGGNLGIGFAVPINSVKAILPQLRRGKVVRGDLGVELHEGPILDDEARQLGLPTATGALIKAVTPGSAAARAGLRPGDVIHDLGGFAVADTRAFVAHITATAPGTELDVRVYRDGIDVTRKATVDEKRSAPPTQAASVDEMATGEDIGGLLLDEVSRAQRNLKAPRGISGALVVDVVRDGPADEASLGSGDVIRSINRHSVRTAAEARAELRAIPSGAPIFLSVWRKGAELFLVMRKD